jgi:putative FmdB family regulatory protein
MPKYDLRCLECGEEFQLTMKMSDFINGHAMCDACGSSGVERDYSKGHELVVDDQTRWKKGEFGAEDRK